ncbi:hypothetical protein NV226_00730 [Mycoplasma iguanae]|uniref:Uncharacterized protein n=1 Tax=Mycoplasma iguanae TaxID=292461 RepID=A0ABY5R959_9MOLU|nr:hypothetical protein [Mycoplasma iguanae]UVD81826.1 hypothetical protein NV226_00730 [Mycoplasma iguanae]
MDNDINFLKNKLIDLYGQNSEKIKKLTAEEMQQLIYKIEKDNLDKNSNPNKFFILNSMPKPKKWETKTSPKAGIWVIIAFIFIFIIFGILMFYLAFANN